MVLSVLASTRRGCGSSWHVDETYLKVRDRWVCFYRR